jgi:hypothetical protein
VYTHSSTCTQRPPVANSTPQQTWPPCWTGASQNPHPLTQQVDQRAGLRGGHHGAPDLSLPSARTCHICQLYTMLTRGRTGSHLYLQAVGEATGIPGMA